MMNTKLLALSVLALTGCGNTVRYLTPITWSNGPDGVAAPAAPAAASTDGAAPASSDPDRILYLTYWEGSCSGGFAGVGKGCSKGDTKIKRCNLKPDNSMVCVDEAEASKAFSTSN